MPMPHPVPGTRDLRLPPEGAEALRTVLGILDDAMAPIDPFLAADLDERLAALWVPADGAVDDTRVIPISVEEADLVLAGLRYTEAMSTELPWYPMVIDAVQFVADAVLDLWSDDEWVAWRAWRGP
jgi:hypothetical protein